MVCFAENQRSAPCNAGEVVAGDCEKVSRSRRMDDDCFRAELNREFYIYMLAVNASWRAAAYHLVNAANVCIDWIIEKLYTRSSKEELKLPR